MGNVVVKVLHDDAVPIHALFRCGMVECMVIVAIPSFGIVGVAAHELRDVGVGSLPLISMPSFDGSTNRRMSW